MKIDVNKFYQQKDLTGDGKIPIIVQAKDEKVRKNLEKICCTNEKGEVTGQLKIIDSFTAHIYPENLLLLAKLIPETAKIYLDTIVRIPEPEISIPENPPMVMPKTDVGMPVSGVDKLWEKGFTGKDVTIAVIDTGIYLHKDFSGNDGKTRVVAFKDFVNKKTEAYDDQGHGTHVAGIAAGNGLASDGKYKGAAPDAKLAGVKVLNKYGSGYLSTVIEGIEWAVDNKDTFNIKVINMSLGASTNSSYKDDPMCQAVEKAYEAGIMPVIAAGNSGPKPNTIGRPANAPSVITIGALDDNNTVEKDDDKIAGFSSRGPSNVDKLDKPDIVFPGVKITSCLSPGSQLDSPSIPHVGSDYIIISGTSMATPGTAGVVADLLQANPKIKLGKLKSILMETADPLKGYNKYDQGKGLVDAVEALDKVLAEKNTKLKKTAEKILETV